ncbi:MAG: dihydrolipoamide acetyltransferase family protein [Vicinamibacterales bacterium]
MVDTRQAGRFPSSEHWMATNVVMPQMGESVAEGTVTRWIKKVGDSIDRDEPLFEISTDKVDAEIPAPSAGTLLEIRVKEGETVAVDTIVAIIGSAGERASTATHPAPPQPPPAAEARPVASTAALAASVAPAPVATAPVPPETPDAERARLRRQKSSPLVRRIAKDHGIDVSALSGTGLDGRVTKQDILKVVESGGVRPAASAAPTAEPHRPSIQPGERVEVVPMTVMRRRIAEHMIASQRTSAHVYSVVEADFTKVAATRAARKGDFERAGTKLTFMAFIAKATIDALRAVPIVNAALDGENIVYKKDINLGMAVALDWGLIVPVIKHADEKNLLGLSRAIADLAGRARAKQLKPDDVQGGTFTITNPGSLGTLLGMPIINQPQVAILGVGAIEKRVVVIDDAIGIRQRGYLTLGYDHRLIDGAVADEFLARVKKGIENFDAE